MVFPNFFRKKEPEDQESIRKVSQNNEKALTRAATLIGASNPATD